MPESGLGIDMSENMEQIELIDISIPYEIVVSELARMGPQKLSGILPRWRNQESGSLTFRGTAALRIFTLLSAYLNQSVQNVGYPARVELATPGVKPSWTFTWDARHGDELVFLYGLAVELRQSGLYNQWDNRLNLERTISYPFQLLVINHVLREIGHIRPSDVGSSDVSLYSFIKDPNRTMAELKRLALLYNIPIPRSLDHDHQTVFAHIFGVSGIGDLPSIGISSRVGGSFRLINMDQAVSALEHMMSMVLRQIMYGREARIPEEITFQAYLKRRLAQGVIAAIEDCRAIYSDFRRPSLGSLTSRSTTSLGSEIKAFLRDSGRVDEIPIFARGPKDYLERVLGSALINIGLHVWGDLQIDDVYLLARHCELFGLSSTDWQVAWNEVFDLIQDVIDDFLVGQATRSGYRSGVSCYIYPEVLIEKAGESGMEGRWIESSNRELIIKAVIMSIFYRFHQGGRGLTDRYRRHEYPTLSCGDVYYSIAHTSLLGLYLNNLKED